MDDTDVYMLLFYLLCAVNNKMAALRCAVLALVFATINGECLIVFKNANSVKK